MHKSKAFTLIELLVVIAIIAILAAILFPVFAQAKRSAKQTTGVSNVKGVALAHLMYANDSDDHFVQPNLDAPWPDWIYVPVAPYVNGGKAFDPKKPGAFDDPIRQSSKIMAFGGNNTANWESWSGGDKFTSNLSNNLELSPWPTEGADNHPVGAISTTAVEQSANTVMVFSYSGDWAGGPRGIRKLSDPNSPEQDVLPPYTCFVSVYQVMDDRYNGGSGPGQLTGRAVVGLADGHVKQFTPEQTVPPAPYTDTTKNMWTRTKDRIYGSQSNNSCG